MSKRILVVDDQASMRLSLKGILTKKGFEVAQAEDGQKAIEAAQATEFDLVLMDIRMPGISGVEAFVQIKKIRPNLPVIMMTAYAVEDEIQRAIREGAHTVLYKPLDIERALATINECMDSPKFVLLVDDRAEDRFLYRAILERKGYLVSEAASGEESLKLVKEKKFKAVLLDIRLPGIDGLETYKNLKAIRPSLPIIVLTARIDPRQQKEAEALGYFPILIKPATSDQIAETLERAIREASEPDSTQQGAG